MERGGELFISLEPTIEESRRSGGRYQYQQLVVESLIQEFGTQIIVICQVPARARFQLNNGNIAKIVSDGIITLLSDPRGNSKEKHQASNMIFSTIQGFTMQPTSTAPLNI
jgi:hypothetical protein